MEWVDMITENAVRAMVGGLIAGFLAGLVLALRTIAKNETASRMLESEIRHRDEIRDRDREAIYDKFATQDKRMEHMEHSIELSKDVIMAKLNQIEREIAK